MTLIEVTYEVQSSLSPAQLGRLATYANTYGLRKFRVDSQRNLLTFEYDASRLKDTQVTNVLLRAGIPVLRRVEPQPA